MLPAGYFITSFHTLQTARLPVKWLKQNKNKQAKKKQAAVAKTTTVLKIGQVTMIT